MVEEVPYADVPGGDTYFTIDGIESGYDVVLTPSSESDSVSRPITYYALDNLGDITAEYVYDGSGVALSDLTSYLAANPDEPNYDGLLRGDTTYSYDAQGRIQEVDVYSVDQTSGDIATGSGSTETTAVVFDGDGNVVQLTDPSGVVTTYTYNALDWLTSEQQADPVTDGSDGTVTSGYLTTTYAYDSDGNLTSVTDPMGNVTTYFYDAAGREIAEFDPDPTTGDYTPAPSDGDPGSPEIQYAYDSAGNLQSETDPDGNTTSYTYDALGRELSQADELGDTTYYAYDGDGNVLQSTDPDGQVIQYTYNDLNQLLEQDWFDSSDTQTNSITYKYDNLGDMLTATDTYPSADASQDSAYAFTYNVLGHQTSVDNLGGESGGSAGTPDVVLTSGYDALGNRTSLGATIGGTADFQNAYSYDDFGRESQVTQSGADGGNAVADKLVTFSYNADNQYSEIDTYAGLTTDSTLVTTSIYGYDSIGRLTSLDEGNSSSSTEYAGYSWTYNADSLVSTANNSVYSTEDVAYGYDHDGELTAATYSGDSSLNQSFSYDQNGNQSGSSITLNNTGGSETGNNQITDDGTWTYTYDADGNLTKQVGDSGGAQAGNEIDYSYDVGGRLVEVKNLTDDVVTQDVQYTYDMFGDLIGRKLTLYSDGEPSSTTTGRFAYDVANGQMVLAFDGSGNLTDRFLNGPAVDQILADENYSSPSASPSTAGNTLWMLTDNQGTVRDIVDSSGLVDHLTYNVFGVLTGQTGSGAYASTDVLFAGYTGSFYDSATGLQCNGARWYSPALGRWMSQDPAFPSSGINPYEYCWNSVVNFTDPSGLQATNSPTMYPILGLNWIDPWFYPTPGQTTTSPVLPPSPPPGVYGPIEISPGEGESLGQGYQETCSAWLKKPSIFDDGVKAFQTYEETKPGATIERRDRKTIVGAHGTINIPLPPKKTPRQ